MGELQFDEMQNSCVHKSHTCDTQHTQGGIWEREGALLSERHEEKEMKNLGIRGTFQVVLMHTVPALNVHHVGRLLAIQSKWSISHPMSAFQSLLAADIS